MEKKEPVQTDITKFTDVEIKAYLWEIDQNITKLSNDKNILIKELVRRYNPPVTPIVEEIKESNSSIDEVQKDTKKKESKK